MCKPGSTVAPADGAHAYERVIKTQFKKLRHRAVVHSNLEFVRRIAPVRLKSGSTSPMDGTQAVDSTWRTLDDSIPRTLHTKKSHMQNPLLETYAFSWVFRVKSKSLDGFARLGKLI